jgi:hypothetical protein
MVFRNGKKNIIKIPAYKGQKDLKYMMVPIVANKLLTFLLVYGDLPHFQHYAAIRRWNVRSLCSHFPANFAVSSATQHLFRVKHPSVEIKITIRLDYRSTLLLPSVSYFPTPTIPLTTVLSAVTR